MSIYRNGQSVINYQLIILKLDIVFRRPSLHRYVPPPIMQIEHLDQVKLNCNYESAIIIETIT